MNTSETTRGTGSTIVSWTTTDATIRKRSRVRRRLVGGVAVAASVSSFGIWTGYSVRTSGDAQVYSNTVHSVSVSDEVSVPALPFEPQTTLEGLPTGWALARTSGILIKEGAQINATRQVWGASSGDGPSLTWAVVLTITKSGMPATEPEWSASPAADAQGFWFTGSERIELKSDGLTQVQTAAFFDGLSARDSGNLLQGFDSSSGDALYEDIGDGGFAPQESVIRLDLQGPDGDSATVFVGTRDRAPVGLGTPVDRVLIGDAIGIVSPAGVGFAQVDWVSDHLLFTVAASSNDVALAISNVATATSTEEWRQLVVQASSAKTALVIG